MVKSISTEQKIIEAAHKVFTRKGMAGARMQEIADEAGINKALLHYYFRSKQKLFEKIFIEAFRTITVGLGSVFSEKGTIMEKLKKFIDLYIDVLIKHPFLPVFVLGELNQNPGHLQEIIEKDMSDVMGAFMKELLQEIEMGNIIPFHPVHMMLNLLGMILFPFIAKPLVAPLLQKNIGIDYENILIERKEEIYKFLSMAILPKKNE